MSQEHNIHTLHRGDAGSFLRLDPHNVTLALSGALTLTVCLMAFCYHRDKRKLGNLPGPEVLPGPKSCDPTGVIGILSKFLPMERTIPQIVALRDTYGDIFKFSILGQTVVWMNNGPCAQAQLKSTDVGHLAGAPAFYHSMTPFLQKGVMNSIDQVWRRDRKLLIKTQTYQNLKNFFPVLCKHCQNFVSNLEEMFGDGEAHPINDLINSSFIKVISEMITGVNNDQFEEETVEYHHNFKIWTYSVGLRNTHPWLLFTPFWKLHPQSRKHDVAIEEMREFARRRIHEHRRRVIELDERNNQNVQGHNEEETSPGKSTSTFRSVLDELFDGGVEDEQMVDELNSMLFGGHETGATTIHFFFLCMALNPEIQEKCQKEVDELFEDPNNLRNGAITFEAVNSKLKLVERCVQETLRLYTPGIITTRKLHSPLKIDFKGQDVLLPPGTTTIVSPYLLHRNPEHYTEPLKYDPDRFLPEECTKRHQYAFLPFSAGPKGCLGRKFAMIELRTVAAYALRHFKISTPDPVQDIPLMPYLTLTPARDYNFILEKRNIRAS